jgi:hypothetical protein
VGRLMAGKAIIFSESVPEQRTKHLVVLSHSVFFCFDVDRSTLLTEHSNFLKTTMVPFVGRALKRLGPGTYDLIIHGSASATGSTDHNFELGARRASVVANETIRLFEEQKKTDPSLSPFSLNPVTIDHGDEDAELDPLLAGARKHGTSQVEKVQAIFRSAVFNFRAKQGRKSATFQIREIYFFKFKKVEQDLPAVLKAIDDFLDKPVQGFIFRFLRDKLLDPVKKALGEVGFLAGHLISFLIPSTADYCFEIKDSLNDHALYRFNGVEHKDSFGILDLISFVTKLLGVIQALEKAAKAASTGSALAKKLFSIAEGIGKVTDELIDKLFPLLEKTFGRGVAQQIKDLFLQLRKGSRSLFEVISVPGSGFTAFRFHDNQADHDVKQLSDPARRIAVDAAFHSSVEIFFGGSATPSSTAFKAQAHILTGFLVRNSLFLSGTADGIFIPVKLGYLIDVAPGLFDPVTDSAPAARGKTLGRL